ncbi:isochorismatase family protein [Arenibacter sp. M-2]|uniref:isochorismatase family protein n=1 Tax=Arenibacter sp. M-2 TaxID=3053612 RepID=UPI0025707BF0|nr:isochorismatase family protein [Arenibacter sp. M-2]MDL5511225.1 isochorismatase family protein [Arenibacter sp. M-2]
MDYTKLNWQKSALLIIDMQKDFTLLDGASPIEGTLEVVPYISEIADTFRRHNRPIIHIIRLYKEDGSNVDLCRRALIENGKEIVKPYSEGAQIIPALLPANSIEPNHSKLLSGEILKIAPLDYVMYKPRWGAFYQTGLESFLHKKGIDSLLIIGCNFPNCPRTTIYQASERDFKIGIIPTALSGLYEKGITEVQNIGVEIIKRHQLEKLICNIALVDYRPEWQPYFEQFNKAWLTKYYTVEPLDEYVLIHPEEAILNDGGCILFAQYKGKIIGTVALKHIGDGVMELTKMAVDESYQGLGAGKILCQGAIDKARLLKVMKLILYSQRKLTLALNIYQKHDFKEIPLEDGKYIRADVMMELIL